MFYHMNQGHVFLFMTFKEYIISWQSLKCQLIVMYSKRNNLGKVISSLLRKNRIQNDVATAIDIPKRKKHNLSCHLRFLES